MARCSICGAETRLYLDGIAICIPCDDKRLLEETERKKQAQAASTQKQQAQKKSA